MKLMVGIALALAGCKAPTSSKTEPVVLPPPSGTATSPSVTASAAPPSAPADLRLLGGELVDLTAMKSVRVLTTDLTIHGALTGDTAYLHVRDVAAGTDELRAYDVATGALRWAKPPDHCWEVVATRDGTFCSNEHGTTFFDRAAGASRAVGPVGRIGGLTVLGSRVLVLTDDPNAPVLESLDEKGVTVGHIKLSSRPVRTFGKSAFVAIGGVACGASGNDLGTDVLCVDASPRVVWQRNLALPNGALTQADANAIVLSIERWRGRTSATEIVRTSDGSTLLHLAGVSVSAAIAGSTGNLETLVADDVDLAVYDGAGKKQWSVPGGRGESVRAARVGTSLVVARFSASATGAELLAFELASGKKLWTGDMEFLPISHSRYSNDVELRVEASRLLMLGTESGQVYAESFDPSTGKRTASLLRGR